VFGGFWGFGACLSAIGVIEMGSLGLFLGFWGCFWGFLGGFRGLFVYFFGFGNVFCVVWGVCVSVCFKFQLCFLFGSCLPRSITCTSALWFLGGVARPLSQ